MCSRESDREELTFQEAADWLLILNNAAEGSPRLVEFHQWLSASEQHRRAWNRVSETWNMLGAGGSFRESGEISTVREPDDLEPGVRARAPLRTSRRPATRYRGIAAAGAALAVFCAVIFAAPAVLLQIRADYLTAAGQTERIQLGDGTTIDLGGGSAISAEVSGNQRQVTLLAGEAFFEVAPDPQRPFIVDAKGLELRVLGTAFDVRMTSSSTTVALLHGSVEIDPASGLPRRLSPGQMLEVDHGSGTVTVADIAPEDIGAWRGGRVFLTDVTVGSVIEMIQRYHTAWISVPDPGLSSLKVSGLFDLRDPDAALAALVRPFGGKVRSVTSLARVITRL